MSLIRFLLYIGLIYCAALFSLVVNLLTVASLVNLLVLTDWRWKASHMLNIRVLKK